MIDSRASEQVVMNPGYLSDVTETDPVEVELAKGITVTAKKIWLSQNWCQGKNPTGMQGIPHTRN